MTVDGRDARPTGANHIVLFSFEFFAFFAFTFFAFLRFLRVRLFTTEAQRTQRKAGRCVAAENAQHAQRDGPLVRCRVCCMRVVERLLRVEWDVLCVVWRVGATTRSVLRSRVVVCGGVMSVRWIVLPVYLPVIPAGSVVIPAHAGIQRKKGIVSIIHGFPLSRE